MVNEYCLNPCDIIYLYCKFYNLFLNVFSSINVFLNYTSKYARDTNKNKIKVNTR